MITAQTFWNPVPVTAATKSAFRVAALQQKVAAQAAVRGSSGIRSKMTVRFVAPTVAILTSRDPKAHWWELGVEGHEIAPRNLGRGRGTGVRSRRRKGTTGQGVAIKFTKGDGGFTRAPFRHPGMAARPFLKPPLPLFPRFYQGAARAALGSIGARAF